MRSWQVLKIWGIPFKIHPYWIVLLFLFSWSISDQINLTSSELFNKQEAWLIGFFTSFFLLCSIILHQIFHTYICLHEGVKIKKITFFFLGAVLEIEKDCQSALGNIKISLVRPLLCFITSIFLLLIGNFSVFKEQIFINIIIRVGVLNLFLGIFNLIPVGTLDGGNLLKSVIWYFSGNKNKGRILLNQFTILLSIIILTIGIFLLFSFNFYYGLILCLLSIFGINISKSDNQYLKIEKILKSKNIYELKLKPLRKIEFDLTLKQFNSLIKDKNNFNNYFFITKNGRWDGFISVDVLKNITVKKWDLKTVSDFSNPISNFPSIYDNIPLWQIIEKIEKTSGGIILITNPYGIPMGLLDRENIGRFVLKKLGFNISNDILNKIKSKNNYPLGIELPKIIKLMKSKGDI